MSELSIDALSTEDRLRVQAEAARRRMHQFGVTPLAERRLTRESATVAMVRFDASIPLALVRDAAEKIGCELTQQDGRLVICRKRPPHSTHGVPA